MESLAWMKNLLFFVNLYNFCPLLLVSTSSYVFFYNVLDITIMSYQFGVCWMKAKKLSIAYFILVFTIGSIFFGHWFSSYPLFSPRLYIMLVVSLITISHELMKLISTHLHVDMSAPRFTSPKWEQICFFWI